MPNLLINSIPVDFPYEPYPSQIEYMSKVIECLESRKFGLLESPTGTGKTLCLLCATLSWRIYIRNKLKEKLTQKPNIHKVGSTSHLLINENDNPDNICIPNIIYASRTHSQLTQVVQQLKTTLYKSNVVVIGSREQLCIHPQVNKLQFNSEKVNLCRAMLKTRSCTFYNKLDKSRASNSYIFQSGINDIEDLLVFGKKLGVCPYYSARESKHMSDIIFMPYNYILDPKLRHINGIDLKNSIIILDEAHNIEKICEESASFEITSIDFAHALSDIDYLIKLKVDSNDICNEKEELIRKLVNIKATLLKCESNLDSIDVPSNGVCENGFYMYTFFQKANINFETAQILLEQLDVAISLYSVTSVNFGFNRSSQTIQKLVDVVKILFSDIPNSGANCMQHAKQLSRSYKVFIKSVDNNDSIIPNGLLVSTNKTNRKYKILSYWCFSAGRSMRNIISNKIWTLILTSGTLSPFESLIYELQIDFPIKLQNPHVVDPNHVWVGVVKRGPNNIELSSSYQNRNDPKYQESLGEALVSLSRVIPKGMLIFFPSYATLSNSLSVWRNNGILKALEARKQIFEEPKSKSSFSKVMHNFTSTLPNDDDIASKDTAFFAVCRGKVSEGLDFKDDVCRGLIITGLPFPPKNDQYVQLKMKYLDEECTDSVKSGFLSGNIWYKQQASRTVNQALGRVIRHKNDYGAIILADTRFSWSSNISDLPNWIKPNLSVYDNFTEAINSLSQFYSRMNLSKSISTSNSSTSDIHQEAFSFTRKPKSYLDGNKRKLNSLSCTSPQQPKKNKFEPSLCITPKVKCSTQQPLRGSFIDNLQVCPDPNTINRKINLYTNSKDTINTYHDSQTFPSTSNINNSIKTSTASINPKHKSIASKMISKMHISSIDNSLGKCTHVKYNDSSLSSGTLKILNLNRDEDVGCKPELSKRAKVSEMLLEAKSVLTQSDYSKLSKAIKSFHLNNNEKEFKSILNSIFNDHSLQDLLNKFLCFCS